MKPSTPSTTYTKLQKIGGENRSIAALPALREWGRDAVAADPSQPLMSGDVAAGVVGFGLQGPWALRV